MFNSIRNTIKHFSFTPTKQQAFLEDFAMLIEDGVPAKQAIEILAEVNEGSAIELATGILVQISQGRFIADGMQGWFPEHIVEIIRAGEEGGALAKSLKAAAESLTQKTSALSSVVGSITYPLAVVLMGAAVAVFINHSILKNFRAILPFNQWPTVGQDLSNFAYFIQDWWWAVIVSFIIIGFFISKLLRTYIGEGRHMIDTMPVIALYRQLIAARFMQTLGLLIENGVVFKKALKILQLSANPYLAWHLLTMEYRLGGGKENIAEVLDTGLIDTHDLVRLRVIARGKGFEHALIRQGLYAQTQSNKTIKLLGRILGSILLAMGAMLAVFLITGIYTVGSSVGAY